MFLRYAFRKEEGKIVLYLYKTTQFEFAKEWTPKTEGPIKTLEEEAISYIKEKHLPTSFDKIYVLIDGKIVKTISKDAFQVEDATLKKKEQDETQMMIPVKGKEKTEKVSLLNYLVGTLFTTCDFPIKKEALKALVILFRTFALESIEKNGFVEAKNHFVIYQDPLLYKLIYLENFDATLQLFQEAVLETEGLYLFSNGSPVKPYVHLISSGYTRRKEHISYLVPKESLWDMKAKKYLQQFFFSYSDLLEKLHLTKEEIKKMTPLDEETFQFGKQHLSRNLLSKRLQLPSLQFTCIEEKDGLTIICRGIGNDLGLSIYGANHLAEQGFTYSQILAYYFQNILLFKL